MTMTAAYSVFVVDPPWPQRKGGRRASRPNQGRALDYATMSIEDIFALLDSQIFVNAATNHSVFMWTIDKFLRETEDEMFKRGYRLHCRMVWDKENGIAPAFTVRFSHEYLLWFYKPTLIPVDQRGKFRTVIRERARQHSRKPDAAYRVVEALYPKSLRMDVFSRERRTGWSQFGNECDYFRDTGGRSQ